MWCDVAWRGTTGRDVTLRDTARHDTTRHDMIYDTQIAHCFRVASRIPGIYFEVQTVFLDLAFNS